MSSAQHSTGQIQVRSFGERQTRCEGPRRSFSRPVQGMRPPSGVGGRRARCPRRVDSVCRLLGWAHLDDLGVLRPRFQAFQGDVRRQLNHMGRRGALGVDLRWICFRCGASGAGRPSRRNQSVRICSIFGSWRIEPERSRVLWDSLGRGQNTEEILGSENSLRNLW